jgi:putative ATP-dependent endonuclease of OLD family
LKSPFISRVKIKNFRNFKDIDVNLSHKQIIIGENNVGKTNFLRAIQLILDPKLSDVDRQLSESDFHNSLPTPMIDGEQIEISIEIQNYEHNKSLLSILSDATVSDDPPTLRLTYSFYPVEQATGVNDYQYSIYLGENQTIEFTHFHRKYLNIKVINALRDVENEMKNSKKSPIVHLIKQYEFERQELETIARNIKAQSDQVLSLDELLDLTSNINARFSKIVGIQPDSQVNLATNDIEPSRILTTLKLLMGENNRSINDTSLGLTNILYISLVLLSLEDKTIPGFLKNSRYQLLKSEENGDILDDCYEVNANQNYLLKNPLTDDDKAALYDFMDQHNQKPKGFTILALEEPESHLHPTLQRVIYKDVMHGDTSILMTTHSPHITSVAPLESIVHLRSTSNGTRVTSTADLLLEPRERSDLERYLDVKRGELYFGRGVILVEGVAEEYILPRFAELIGKPLDLKGIIICNINSTNFKPYVKFLDLIRIPYIVITDGDYYEQETPDSERKYHVLSSEKKENYFGYLGNELIGQLLIDLDKINADDIPEDFIEQDQLFNQHGIFLGVYTLEVDIMDTCSNNQSEQVIIDVFNSLTLGGGIQKRNFKTELESKLFYKCLSKIESSNSGIGKGRFAQAFSISCIKEHVPNYIKNAINTIFDKVDE